MMKHAALAVLLGGCTSAPRPRPGKPEPLPREKHEAIQAGVAWLRLADLTHEKGAALLALIRAGVDRQDALCVGLGITALDVPLEDVETVAFQAMAFEDFDRVRFQWRLWKCARVLVDSQCGNGRWSSFAAAPPNTDQWEIPVPVKALIGRDGKPKVQATIPVRARRGSEGPGDGDPWNTLPAVLAMRACRDGGISFEERVARRAASTRSEKLPGTPRTMAAETAMRAVCDVLLGIDRAKDTDLQLALQELAKMDSTKLDEASFWAVDQALVLGQAEPGAVMAWRAGAVQSVLAGQLPDGSWRGDVPRTCFALIFLAGARTLDSSLPASERR